MGEAAVRPPAGAAAVRLAGALTRVQPFEETFRAEFERLFASLFRYLDRLSGDPAVAADLAQEALLRLYQRGSMPDNVRAWLAAIAHNLLRNQQRRGARRRWLLAARPTFALADPAPSPDAAAEAAEGRERVRAALDSLALRDRQMLLLRYEGYSYREIAVALDLAESSVGTLLARARESFRRALKDDRHASE